MMLNKSVAKDFSGITDNKVIDIALNENRIILTFDKDYGELIFRLSLQKPPAVVFYRFKGTSPDFAGELLLKLIEENQISLDNTFTVIEQNNIRQRKY